MRSKVVIGRRKEDIRRIKVDGVLLPVYRHG